MDVYSIKGKVLELGVLAGNSSMSLDDAVKKYSSEGRYKISFSKNKIIENALSILTGGLALPESFRGTFEQPTIGWLTVITTKSPVNYSITGESYGKGIVPVIADFAEILGLKAINVNHPLYTMGFEQAAPYLLKDDITLSACKTEEERKRIYLGLIKNTKEFIVGLAPKPAGISPRPDPNKFPPSKN